jgi:shikimate dehydrogenase
VLRGSPPFRHCAGVLGWPLEHTLSPVIHNAAFRSLDLDWSYFSWPVEPDRVGDAVRGIAALGAAGANVTMPHKESVIEHLDSLEGAAEATGAVNTIHNLAGRLVGHNTDVTGFRALLVEDLGFEMRDRTALVLGAGGAARAVVKALSDGGATVRIAARRSASAARLGTVGEVETVAWESIGSAAEEVDLIVNATPLGMKGEDPLRSATFRTDQTVVDLLYNPPSTPLIERARASGADAWGGLGMLVHQAASSFEIWTGREPPLEVMSAAAIHALGHLKQ